MVFFRTPLDRIGGFLVIVLYIDCSIVSLLILL